MAAGMNRDFAEMLSALCEVGAEFLVVGAHALAAHGLPRATGDLDLWVRPTVENAARVWAALRRFGAPLQDLTENDLATADVVFQIGVPPCRIDLMTSISGVSFDDAWPKRMLVTVEGQQFAVLSRQDLVDNKKATDRPKDRADLEALRRSR